MSDTDCDCAILE